MSVKPKILVTGGAGYVGSHTCKALAQAGFEPVTYDDFSNGHRGFVQWGPLEQGDIRDRTRLTTVLATHQPAAIIHLAARAEVAISFDDPAGFYDVNVNGSLAVIETAREAGIGKIVFASSCSVYGTNTAALITENHETGPISPYGRSKLMVEEILKDVSASGAMQYAALRYFNVAGADPDGQIGERHDPETHVIPLLLQKTLSQQDCHQGSGIACTEE